MRTDVPVFQRCCFCLPLRCGLLVWGYFKLITASLLLGYYSSLLHYGINLFVVHKETTLIKEIVINSGMVSTLVIDTVLHAIFIIGAHKRHVSFLKVYYFCALTLLVLTILLGIVNIDLMIKNMVNHGAEHLGNLFVMKTTAMFINLLIQAHIILLVRSEIDNLKVMGSAESEVTLQCESLLIRKEKSIDQETNMVE
ncbi:unnamed protein product [Arctia plantaginis]|uniref:Uncharacterized protein n=1 Tax=Arctia plantaginis TaxID=874455 RepID=A0A8S0ZAQ1_ARCPL|nr:unnamed protein product [Arctia plantaginis]